jgi:hypothetical protein
MHRMIKGLDRTAPAAWALAADVAHASAAIARLDQALASHPLQRAFLYRVRLDAVRRQAAVDGRIIDPWHLAAMIEGLRLRMDLAFTIAERGQIFEAARHAFSLYQWLTAPDFDAEGAVKAAERTLAEAGKGMHPLLAAAHAMPIWLDAGGIRPAIRTAIVRLWTREKVTRLPLPLTGAAALKPEEQGDEDPWTHRFLHALGEEAADWLQLLIDMERAWLRARAQVADRRRNSRAGMAVDMLAAAPIASASTLAVGLGMAVQNVSALLQDFCRADIAVEVTHRSKRRLYSLANLAPVRDRVAPPRRPEPGRGRGRPPIYDQDDLPPEPVPLPPVSMIERRAFDYSDLEHWMEHLDRTIGQMKRSFDTLTR